MCDYRSFRPGPSEAMNRSLMSSKKQNVGPHPGKRKNTKLNERKGEERVYKKMCTSVIMASLPPFKHLDFSYSKKKQNVGHLFAGKNQYFKVLIVLLSQLHINKPETNKLDRLH